MIYAPFGPHTGIAFGNGLADARAFDSRYRMGTWTLGSLISKTYAWQDDDNITAITDNLNSANNRTFGYDAIHRLTTASGPWGAGSYTYDANGNRQSKTEGASNTSYAYTAGTNRLATATGSEPATYGYDANGNTTSDGAHTYQYSQRDRLATVDSGTTGTYSYDGDGRRVKKVASGVTTLYFYDPDGKLLEEYIPATGAGKDYVWLPGSYEPLARVDFAMSDADNGNVLRVTKSSPNVHLDWSLDGTSGPFVLMRSLSFTFSNPVYLGPGQTAKTFDDAVLNNGQSYAYEAFRRTLTDTLYFYHDDHLGTPIAMTNTSGALVWRAEHTPFGGIYALTVGTITNNLRFPGQYFDGETGLAQNYFRDYRSTIGRYWSPDQLFALDVTHGVWPAELSPGQYAYVESSPVNYIDPFGLWRWYGNWGGPNWTGGQKGTWDTIDRSKAKPPIDKQDACYMDHDICYGGCRECKQCKPKARADCFRDCDRKLVKCLRGLGNDPSNNWKAKAAARYFEHSNPGPNS